LSILENREGFRESAQSIDQDKEERFTLCFVMLSSSHTIRAVLYFRSIRKESQLASIYDFKD